MRVVAGVVLVTLSAFVFSGGAAAGEPEQGRDDGNRTVDAEQTVSGEPDDRPPPPPCYWTSKPATATDKATEQGFWRRIDGGDHYEDVIVFMEDGTLRRTWITSQVTYVLQVRVCDDPNDPDHGNLRWTEVGPPNPELLWEELTERVTKRVPYPEWELGMTREADGSVRVVVNLGLWISVPNADDVVARAEPAPGVWAETRATLTGISFDPGNGAEPIPCLGAGVPLPSDRTDTTEQGPCGYTYTSVDDIGPQSAAITATWSVTSTASTNNSQPRPPIVLQTPIPIEVYEIQTVGTG